MSVVTRPWERTATLDEFLQDPQVRDELASVFEHPDGSSPDAVLKVRDNRYGTKGKREKVVDVQDAADWIIGRWLELRP